MIQLDPYLSTQGPAKQDGQTMDSCLTCIPTVIKRRAASGAIFTFLGLAPFVTSLAMPSQNHSQEIPDFYRQYVRRENVGTSTRAELRNGLKVIVEEYAVRPIAAVTLVVGTGYADEAASSTGAASALAWWIRLHSVLAEKIALEGGHLESEASARETLFTVVLPAANLLSALEILAGLLDPSLLEEISLDQIRVPATSGKGHEAWLTFQGAERRLWELVNPEFGSRIAALEIAKVPVLGSELTRQDLIHFHRDHYQSGNLSIIVSGGIVRERILARIAELYAGLGNTTVSASPATASAQQRRFRYEHRREEKVPLQCLFGYRIPGRAHPDMLALQLVQAALSGSRGLLVYHLVQKGLAFNTELMHWPSAQGGLLAILLFPDKEKIDEAEVRLLAVLRSISEKGLEAHDLTRAKGQLVRQYMARLRSHQERARILSAQAGDKNWSDLNEWPRRVSMLTNEQVKRVASRYLSRENLSLLESFPVTGPLRQFTTESLAETVDLLIPVSIGEVQRDQQVRWDSKATSFEVPTIPQRKQHSSLRRTSILRGPQIYEEEEHTSPVIDIGFFFPGGRVQETEANQGLTELMLRSLVGGTAESSSWRTWETLEEKGTVIEIINEPDFFGFRLQLYSRHLQDAFGEFIEWLRAGRITSEQIARSRQTLSILQEMEQRDLFSAGRLAIRKQLFSAHGYGMSRFGDQKSLASLDLKAAQQWYADLMKGVHPLIVLYGDVEGTAFLPDLIPLLSSSKYRYRSKEDHPAPTGESSPRLLEIGESWIFGGVPGPAQGTRADWTLDVLANLLRLKRFRPDKPGQEQLPTHVKAQRDALFEAGTLFFGRPSPASEAGRQDFFRQLAGLSQTRVTEQDVRNSIVLTITDYHRQRARGPDYLLDLARHLLAGEKPDYQREYLTTIQSLQADDLRAAAARFLGPLARFNAPVDNPGNQ